MHWQIVTARRYGQIIPWQRNEWVYCCYLEFKLCYLKNLKLSSIRIKRIIRANSFAGKKSRRVFALFKSIFLRNQSLSNAGWFYGKKRKIGKGNPYLAENRLSKNEMWCAANNHNDTCHTFGFVGSNLNQEVIYKISNFHEIVPNFTYSQKSYFYKHNWRLIDQLLLPYQFYGKGM